MNCLWTCKNLNPIYFLNCSIFPLISNRDFLSVRSIKTVKMEKNSEQGICTFLITKCNALKTFLRPQRVKIKITMGKKILKSTLTCSGWGKHNKHYLCWAHTKEGIVTFVTGAANMGTVVASLETQHLYFDPFICVSRVLQPIVPKCMYFLHSLHHILYFKVSFNSQPWYFWFSKHHHSTCIYPSWFVPVFLKHLFLCF